MDFSWLAHWLDSANTFFQYIWDFMATGIYQFFKDALVIVTKALIYSYLQFKILMLDISVTVVKEISEESGVTALVKSSWASIPGDIQSTLAFFKIPQGLTLIFSAIPARWAMKFVPGAN
ncbi:Bacteriophage protein [Pseudomonas coronafaciens pv. coronafaciens]|uniref:DUF2523 family protein n=3 Tax=Pseudomonas coronafaciens TaxID=53409 RepID=UPI0006D63F51|nr:DUF2523 family protein [Pseudomonas coronafaciens]KPZ27801.1 hypothetical protein ALO38_200219 [Pseudomonas coronafaciens pv. zizaniae]RMS09839.1 Bacteriophage protein [Pseudomonas coronafaciens pv. coronafaciens]